MLDNHKYNMTKITTQINWYLAHIICKVWLWGRSFSSKNNFDYFISKLETQYPVDSKKLQVPYFQKLVYEDDFERSISLKVGQVKIEYSFSKPLEKTNLIPLFGYEPEREIIKSLYHMTKTDHHNASVFNLVKHRKEKSDGVKFRKDNS